MSESHTMDEFEGRSVKLVVGHKRPEFRLWSGHRFVVFGSGSKGDLVLPAPPRELDDLPDEYCSEYRYLFCLRRYLELEPQIESITISHHRRVVARAPLGEVAMNQPYARVISPSRAAQLTEAELPAEASDGWLISTPFPIGVSAAVHYALHHPVRDWLRFLADAVDASALSEQEAINSSQSTVIIPAATAGVFPADAFIRHMAQLEECAIAFRRSGWKLRSGYQIRSVGFCLERLHSYFILADLQAAGIDAKTVSGYHTVIGGSTLVTGSVPNAGS